MNGKSRDFVAASSQFLSGTVVATAVPITMAAWVYVRIIPSGVMSLATSGSGNHRFTLNLNASNEVGATTRTTASSTATCPGVVVNKWHFVGAVFGAVNSRFAYLDQTVGAEETTSRTPSAPNQTLIGQVGNAANFYDGVIGTCAIWTVALSHGEMALLAQGKPFEDVRVPAAMWEMIGEGGTPETDRSMYGDRFPLTVNAGPIYRSSRSPVLRRPRRRFTVDVPAAAAVTGWAHLTSRQRNRLVVVE